MAYNPWKLANRWFALWARLRRFNSYFRFRFKCLYFECVWCCALFNHSYRNHFSVISFAHSLNVFNINTLFQKHIVLCAQNYFYYIFTRSTLFQGNEQHHRHHHHNHYSAMSVWVWMCMQLSNVELCETNEEQNIAICCCFCLHLFPSIIIPYFPIFIVPKRNSETNRTINNNKSNRNDTDKEKGRQKTHIVMSDWNESK